jgi:hypothetical protein
MEHIGIDVHKVESQICILTESGEIIERRICTQRERFAAVFGVRARTKIIAGRHRLALAVGTATFYAAAPLFVIASLWIKTGVFPNRLEFVEPALRHAPGLSLVTVRGVGILGGWEYEFTFGNALRMVLPAVMFGLYLSVLVAIFNSRRAGPLLLRRSMTSQSGVARGAFALVGNILATSISLTPPCIGVVTTISLLSLVGFGADAVILPYLNLNGSVFMLVSLVFLVQRFSPDVLDRSPALPPRTSAPGPE